MPLVDCPRCGARTAYAPSNPWRPFCSERCKAIDLGAWASNQYVIGGNPQESAPGDDERPADDAIRVGPSR
jgi:endogenous inhibitor of DNA gyrase (YacG/DUF329 family)